MLNTLTVNTNRLNETVHQDFSNATELADYLVDKNVPFRTAHEIVGKLSLNVFNKASFIRCTI